MDFEPLNKAPAPGVLDSGITGRVMFDKVLSGAGNLFKNIKDTSTKVISSVVPKGSTDIRYITSRLIVMSAPAEGLDTVSRHNIDAVREYLSARHDDFMVFNLCSVPYRKDRLLGHVVDCDWPSQGAPLLKDLMTVCADVHTYLEKNGMAVAVLHCMDGKALSAMAISAYFMYVRLFKSPSAGLRVFTRRRFPSGYNGHLIEPSQSRYLHYIHRLTCYGTRELHNRKANLHRIALTNIPKFNLQRTGCKPMFEVAVAGRTLWRSHSLSHPDQIPSYVAEEGQCLSFDFPSLVVEGDISITALHVRSLPGARAHGVNMSVATVQIFRIQFHSSFLEDGFESLSFMRTDLDGVEVGDSRFLPDFSVNVDVEGLPGDTGTKPDSSWCKVPTKKKASSVCFLSNDEEAILVSDFGELDKMASEDLSDLYNSGYGSLAGKLISNLPSLVLMEPSDPQDSEDQQAVVGHLLDQGSDEAFGNCATSTSIGDLLGLDGSVTDRPIPPAAVSGQPMAAANDLGLLGFDFGASADSTGGAGLAAASAAAQAYTSDLGAFSMAPSVNTSSSLGTMPSASSTSIGGDLMGGMVGDLSFDPFAVLDSGMSAPTSPTVQQPWNTTGHVQPASTSSSKSMFNLPTDLSSVTMSSSPSSGARGNSFSGMSSLSSEAPPAADNRRTLGYSCGNSSFLTSPADTRQMSSTLGTSTSAHDPFAQLASFSAAPPVHKSTIPPVQTRSARSVSMSACLTFSEDSSASSRPPADPSYRSVIGSRGDRGLRISVPNGVPQNVGSGAFGDLLSEQGFQSSKQPGPSTSLKEMQNKELEQTMDPVKLKIRKWADGKRKNIRALIAGLPDVLWEGATWNPIGMHQLIQPNDIKKAYRKACLAVHPDKLSGQPQEELAKAVFVELNEAWSAFDENRDMTRVA